MPFFSRIFLLGIGGVFLAAGIGIGVFATRAAQAELARAEALPPSSAVAVRQRGLGSEVLVEGVIDRRNPTRFRDFVAYTRAEYRGTDEDDDEVWVVDERILPPLLVDAGGVIAIAEGYRLEGWHERWQDTEGLRWNGFSGEGTKRYEGLVAGMPVTAIGQVVSGREGVAVRAEFVYAGSRDDYLASRRSTITFLPWFGAIFALVGLGLLSAPVISWLRGRM
jgi:hypothetical protein